MVEYNLYQVMSDTARALVAPDIERAVVASGTAHAAVAICPFLIVNFELDTQNIPAGT